MIKKRWILLLLVAAQVTLGASDFTVIHNPKPNLFEKTYTPLIKVMEIKEELGKNEFLFSPLSAAMDSRHRLYVYDRMQAKILVFAPDFKFIKSFGRKGPGPGEFRYSGRMSVVYLSFGPDGNLYCNEINARKVHVFKPDGTFIKHIIPESNSFCYPQIDPQGNLLLQKFKDDKLVVFNSNNETLLTLPNKNKKKEILFIENKLKPGNYGDVKFPFSYYPLELKMRLLKSNKLILFFTYSATLLVTEKGKILRKTRIWPRELLRYSLVEHEGKKYGYKFLFNNLLLDVDEEGVYYLDAMINKKTMRKCIYKINKNGGLMEVLYISLKNASHYPKFLLKKNNFFFFSENDVLTVYQRRSP